MRIDQSTPENTEDIRVVNGKGRLHTAAEMLRKNGGGEIPVLIIGNDVKEGHIVVSEDQDVAPLLRLNAIKQNAGLCNMGPAIWFV